MIDANVVVIDQTNMSTILRNFLKIMRLVFLSPMLSFFANLVISVNIKSSVYY